MPKNIRKILQQDALVLRRKAKEVPISDIKSSKIQSLLADLNEALSAEHDGVGIAAPQVGESLRIFIVSELVFQKSMKPSKSARATQKNLDKKSVKKESASGNDTNKLVYINPEIISTSKDKKELEEGCLSVRPLYGMVKRAAKVTIRAYDENGTAFERGASGLLAQIFQHEIDHLNGTLFIDKAKNIHEMPENNSQPNESH
jgi:peptide deformylase